MELHSKKLLLQPNSKGVVFSISWNGNGLGSTGNASILYPPPTGKNQNCQYYTGNTSLGISVEKGLYSFEILDSGFEHMNNCGMTMTATMSLFGVCTNAFPLADFQGNIINSCKKGSKCYRYFNGANSLVITVYRTWQSTLSETGTVQVLMKKMPDNYKKPRYYAWGFKQTPNYELYSISAYKETEEAVSGAVRVPEFDLYEAEIK